MNVTVIGLGYIGLPTATLLASKGYDVNGIDVNKNIVKKLKKGEVHFFEPDLDNLFKKVITNKKLNIYNKVKPSNIYIIVVPTPFKKNKEPDISYVETATKSIIPFLKSDDLVIIESTCPVGTTQYIYDLIIKVKPDLKNKINVAYCPERVLPGKILTELIDNDRVIGGVNPNSSKMAKKFYSSFVKGEIFLTNSKTAEMCKLVENSSRDVQIAFANELSMICELEKIDVFDLIDLANRHPRVNILQPGCGVGGHCIAVDPYFLTYKYPENSNLISTSRKVNSLKPSWCLEIINREVSDFLKKYKKHPVISICGLSFKPNVDDLRESPALDIAIEIKNKYKSKYINFIEPNITKHPNFKLSSYENATNFSDIICYLVSHKEFIKKPKNKIIINFCGV